ncbi:MAG: DUF5591 domain-containing protein [Candidatus Heimdallarchaeota archaeon]
MLMSNLGATKIKEILFKLRETSCISKNELRIILNGKITKNDLCEILPVFIDSCLLSIESNKVLIGYSGRNFLILKKNLLLKHTDKKEKKFIIFSMISCNFISKMILDFTKSNETNKELYDFLEFYNIIKVYKTKMKITAFGRKIILLIRAETEIMKFGRKKFHKKTSLTSEEIKELSNFIEEHKTILKKTNHLEAISVLKLLRNEVLKGGLELLNHTDVKYLRDWIFKNYSVNRKNKIAIIIPCSKTKPFSLSPTTKKILNSINDLCVKNNISQQNFEVFIISEPIGIIPLKYQLKYPASNYDMILPGWLPLDEANQIERGNGEKIFQTINNNGKDNKKSNQTEIINSLSLEIGKFLHKYEVNFKYVISYVRSTHRKMIEKAIKNYKLDIKIIPTQEQIQNIIKSKGQIYWVFQGLRSQKAINILKRQLTRYYKDVSSN